MNGTGERLMLMGESCISWRTKRRQIRMRRPRNEYESVAAVSAFDGQQVVAVHEHDASNQLGLTGASTSSSLSESAALLQRLTGSNEREMKQNYIELSVNLIRQVEKEAKKSKSSAEGMQAKLIGSSDMSKKRRQEAKEMLTKRKWRRKRNMTSDQRALVAPFPSSWRCPRFFERHAGQVGLILAYLHLVALFLLAADGARAGHGWPARLGPGGVADGNSERQLQLLRSANVELSRSRGNRLQRDTSPAPVAEQLANHSPTCGYPGSPAHASVTFNTSQVTAGTAATYTCDNGYELLGPPRRICQSNGTWSPIGIPFCVLNVGLGKAAMQSSTSGQGSAQKAVDGSTSAFFQAGTCTMTDIESNPWWYVNLLEPYLVQIVRIDFGTACCANRQKATIAVRVGNNRPDLGNNPLCNRYHGFIEEGKPLFLPCTRPAPGAFVSIHLESPSGVALSICETFIYTDHALSIEQCPSFRDQPLGSTATYNGKCYLFHNNQALNFDGARKYCESRGGTLVDETSPALQGFLSWELYRRHRNDQLMGQYWLGAVRDARNPQNWKWINGKDVQISFWNSLATQGNCSRFDGSKGWLWSDTECSTKLNFICQYRPLSCGKPEKPTNSTLITKNIDNATVIEYQCAPGNLLMGPKSRACLPTGFFSEFAPKCKYLDCQFPAMIQNGDYKLLNGTTSYQSVVNYYCNEGFQIYGKATLTCDVDERWNGPPPRCEPLLCPVPVPPTNGHVTLTLNITLPGSQAAYGCRPGYELAGDHLLTCLQSGSWDNSFPFCKERALAPHTLHVGHPTTTPTPRVPLLQVPPRQQELPQKPVGGAQLPASSGNVHFPTGSPFSPSRVAATATSTSTPPPPPPTTSTTSTSLPVSLNGPAAAVGQFAVAPIGAPQASPAQPKQVSSGGQQQSSQQPSHTISDSGPASGSSPAVESVQPSRKVTGVQSAVSPTPQTPVEGSPVVSPAPPVVGSSGAAGSQQPVARPRPNLSAAASGPQQSFTLLSSPAAGGPATSPTINRQQHSTTSASNKFNSFMSSAQQPTTSSSSGSSYETSPLATTNSISVQPSSTSGSAVALPVSPSFASTAATAAATTTTASSNFAGSTSGQGSSSPTHPSASHTGAGHLAVPHHHHHHHQHSGSNGGPQSVLASFSAPSGVRSHNNLASAKYSLDGIIAVAIFGGFIFLGAIITIIVIIIRRKSSHSSTIDAQTISTYDSSSGERNGLYRNYQQAWENLRFAAPSAAAPKSSGQLDLGLMGASGGLNGPAGGLKNFGSPTAMAAAGLMHPNVHHAHHHMHHPMAQVSGHHNMAMTGSSSSNSSQSGSLDGHGSGGDPLLRGHGHHAHHHGHHAHHHHHHNHRAGPASNGILQRRGSEEEEEDELPRTQSRVGKQQHSHDDELGVTSADETNYGHRLLARGGHSPSGGEQGGEGFRDTNELTVNADTVFNSRPASQAAVARRRLYSGNSIGRANRLSTGAEHHHHHGQAQSGQHQRLVSSHSATPSTSTRSSRGSPPGDEHSLEQLAYGNSWHHTGAGANSRERGDDSSNASHNHSAGSGASILGSRANLRYT